MPLYELTTDGLEVREPTQFVALGLSERGDLQRRLRDNVSLLGADLMVIAEEFGNWEDARRRIDLLALDRDGRLVVIELKRDDGAHMDLQALRYAAMVSSMGFSDVLTAFESHLARQTEGPSRDARAELLAWLDAEDDGDDDAAISADVRIVLVSANFGRELTTAVLWLNQFDRMDIRCVRVIPYEIAGHTLLDVQQVVPLPEAADYQVRLRRKQEEQRRAVAEGKDYTRYHVVANGEVLPDENKRHAIRVMVEELMKSGVKASAIAEVLGQGKFRSVAGEHNDPSAAAEAFAAQPEGFDERRWFLEHPYSEGGRTWLLSNQWGRNTEETLKRLARAFPESQLEVRTAGHLQ